MPILSYTREAPMVDLRSILEEHRPRSRVRREEGQVATDSPDEIATNSEIPDLFFDNISS